MKAIIFLISVAAVVYGAYRWLQKIQAEEERARRMAVRARKRRDAKALKPTAHKTWPVIIRPTITPACSAS